MGAPSIELGRKISRLRVAAPQIVILILSFLVCKHVSQRIDSGSFTCESLTRRGENEWIIDGAAVAEVNGDVQALVDCIPFKGSMLLDVEELKLTETLVLDQPMSIASISSIESNTSSSTRVLCPDGQSAMTIRSRGVSVSGLEFTECVADDSSSMSIRPGSVVIIQNTRFTNNTNSGGSACISARNAVVFLERCHFKSNNGLAGGAVSVKESSVLNIVDSRFESNTGERGGAVTATDSAVNVNASVFKGNKASARGGAIHVEVIERNASLRVTNVDFVNNTLYGEPEEAHLEAKSGGAVAVEGQGATCNIVDSKFNGNSAFGYGGGVLFGNASGLVISNSTFVHNVAFQGGAVSVKTHDEAKTNTTVNFTGVNFTANSAKSDFRGVNRQGGAVVVDTVVFFQLENCIFSGNSAVLAGGGLCLIRIDFAAITNSTFVDNLAEFGAGLELYEVKVDVSGSLFQSNMADGSGGAIYASDGFDGTTVVLEETQFLGNAADSGGAVAVWSGSVIVHSWSILTCVFESNVAYGERRGGGALFLSGSASTYSIGKDTVIKNNRGSRGGGIHAAVIFPGGDFEDPVDLVIQNTLFQGNEARKAGAGGIMLSERISASMFNVTFEGNRGHRGGALYVPQRSSVRIDSCLFLGNNAADGGGGICNENNDDGFNEYLTFWNLGVYFQLTNSVFLNNTAGTVVDRLPSPVVSSLGGEGGAILLLGSGINASLSSSIIAKNIAARGGGIMWKGGGGLEVRDIQLVGNTAALGGGMRTESLPTLTTKFYLWSVQFVGNFGQRGGGLAMGFSGLPFETQANMEYGSDRIGNLVDVVFKNNVALDQGGAVYFEEMRLNCQNCTLISNRAGKRGSRIGTKGKGGAIGVGQNGFAMLRSSRLMQNHAAEGGALFAKDASVDMTAVNFSRNSASDFGGAVAVEYGDGAATESGLLVSCTFCNIDGNRARIGGGVHILLEKPLEFLRECDDLAHLQDFPKHNQQSIFELASMCSGLPDFQSLINNRRIVLENSSMMNNAARQAGAAVFSSDSHIVKVCCQGDCKMIDEDEEYMKHPCSSDKKAPWANNRVIGKRQQAVVSTSVHNISLKPAEIKDHASGFPLEDIKIKFMDVLGQVVFGQNVSLVVKANSSDMVVSGNPVTGVSLQKGISNVTGISVRAKPGNYTLIFTFQVDLPGSEPIVMPVPVEIRQCRIGETFVEQSSSCLTCDLDGYGFNVSESCFPCPPNALCNGSTLVPRNGYWQATSQSTEVFQCVLEAACEFRNRNLTLASKAFSAHRDGELLTWNETDYWQCAEGYNGPLCGSCEEDYGRISAEECGECPGKLTSLFMLLMAFAILVVQTAFLTRQALQPATRTLSIVRKFDPTYLPPGHPGYVEQIESPEVSVTVSGDEGLSHRESLSVDGNEIENAVKHAEDGGGRGGNVGGQTEIELVAMQAVPTVPEDMSVDVSNLDAVRRRKRMLTAQKTFVKLEPNRTLELLKILINFLQVIGTAATINANWTKSVFSILAVSDFVTGVSSGSGLLSLECAFRSSSEPSVMSYLFHLLSPFGVWLLFVVFWLARRVQRKTTADQLIQRFIVGALVILYVSYINVTKKAVKVYNCIDVPMSTDPTDTTATGLWAADTSVRCFKGHHALMMIFVASPVLVVVVVGYPLGLIMKLRANKSKLNDRDFAGKYGFLYKAYQDHAVFWEAFVLMRKGLLATIVVFSEPLDATQQGTLATLVLVLALLLHNLFTPYDAAINKLNMLETWSLTISQLTFLCGVVFYQTEHSDGVRTLLSVAVIGGVVSFVLYMLYELAVSGIQMLEDWMGARGLDREGNLFKDVQVASDYLVNEIRVWLVSKIETRRHSRKSRENRNGS